MTSFVYTVVVPTMNRPGELKSCLESVLLQRPLPLEIVIVDDGELDLSMIQSWLPADGPRLVYIRKESPGLGASYNLAADTVRTRWALFLDDDIILEPDFMEVMSKALSSMPKHTAAVAGYPVQPVKGSARSGVRKFLERVLLLRGSIEGRFLPSSYCTDYGRGTNPEQPWRVQHVPSGLALWRISVLRRLRYDPWFEGYAYGLDKELSLRAAVSHPLFCVPGARALHVKSSRARIPSERLGFMKARNQRFIFLRHRKAHYFSLPLFVYAAVGQIVMLSVAALLSRKPAPRMAEVKGMIRGLFA